MKTECAKVWKEFATQGGGLESFLTAEEISIVADAWFLSWGCCQNSIGARITKDNIRAVGGVVQSDGSVFFTSIEQLKKLFSQPLDSHE